MRIDVFQQAYRQILIDYAYSKVGCRHCAEEIAWCQRAVKSSQVGRMKSSHFEHSEIRGRVSSTPYRLMETLHGESTQYGEDSGDRTATSLKVVPAEDRSGAWN